MLSSIKVTNFHSIGDTQEISFKVNKKDVLDDSSRIVSGEISLNLVNCIIGHNASGKTTALKAISFILWLVSASYSRKQEKIPVEPHKLKINEPTKIEIEFLSEDTLYKYSVELTKDEVLSEYFGKKIQRGFTRIFEYKRSGDNWDFKSPSLEINPSDLKRLQERKRSSILSSLIQLNYIKSINFFENTFSNVRRYGLISEDINRNYLNTSEVLNSDETLKRTILSLSKEIDLGIDDFAFHEEVVGKKKESEDDDKRHLLDCLHKSRAGAFSLELIEESNGTQRSINLITELIPVMRSGGIVIIDEIESGFHPYVAKKIISLFERKDTNPNNSQLFFSTHQHWLLNDRTKTQIFIAEKNLENLETEIFRLDEVEGVRNDENYFSKYLAGTYGGTGNINFF